MPLLPQPFSDLGVRVIAVGPNPYPVAAPFRGGWCIGTPRVPRRLYELDATTSMATS
jgi:hypothetical protein